MNWDAFWGVIVGIGWSITAVLFLSSWGTRWGARIGHPILVPYLLLAVPLVAISLLWGWLA